MQYRALRLIVKLEDPMTGVTAERTLDGFVEVQEPDEPGEKRYVYVAARSLEFNLRRMAGEMMEPPMPGSEGGAPGPITDPYDNSQGPV